LTAASSAGRIGSRGVVFVLRRRAGFGLSHSQSPLLCRVTQPESARGFVLLLIAVIDGAPRPVGGKSRRAGPRRVGAPATRGDLAGQRSGTASMAEHKFKIGERVYFHSRSQRLVSPRVLLKVENTVTFLSTR
jgi:hypothetical protein